MPAPLFELTIDVSQFFEAAKQIEGGASQLPYVFAGLLNDGAFKSRQVWIDHTWPNSVTVRNQAFMSAALHIDKATKQNLVVSLFDKLGRDFLQRLAVGGINQPRRSRSLAIPLKSWVTYTARGIPRAELPKAIIEKTPDRALRITDKGLFVGEGGRLHLRYSWKEQTTQPKLVAFYEDFAYTMTQALQSGFVDKFAQAMKTRK